MRKSTIVGAAVVLALLGGCDKDDPVVAGGPGCPALAAAPGATYNVRVCRTDLGIPHIKANDFASLGYGYGYAHAEDNLCVLQEDLVTIRGERAKYFGREGSHVIIPNASVADNVSSDFFWKFMATDAAWQHLKATADPELLGVTQGFVAGYNRYVSEIKAGGHAGRHAACRAEPWLFPIAEADMYRRYYRLALIASSSVFVDAIAELHPPPAPRITGAFTSAAAVPTAAQLASSELAFFLPENRDKFGSNMYALGKDAVAAGAQPMVFGNPHFPWSGPERLYISHLTVPGKLDIMGASLYGVPAVLIGFTDHFAWSHTVSTAYRFTIYELTLNPDNPTQYVYDGALRDMTAVPLSVEVKDEAQPVQRTLYRSHYGPMMTITSSGQRILPWTHAKAYTLRDANAENDRLINQFARWNQAQSLDEFISLHKTVLGIPWVNTVASGPNGKAYYGDVSVVPHVTNAQIQSCAARPVHDVVQQVAPGLPVLDGSRSACEWGDDTANPDADGVSAPVPGIFGPKNLPKQQREDWVHNCNDSYWLTNPREPITGYNAIIGSENTARSLRTRLCIQHVARHLGEDYADARGPAYDADGDQRFTLKELQETVLASQIYSAQLGRDDVVADICPQGTVFTRSGPVDVSEACAVLQGWTMQSNLADVGSPIWREFFRLAVPNPAGIGPNPLLWTTPFSASDPVNTPRGLNTSSPLVQEALGRAVTLLEDVGMPLDAPLGSVQRSGVIGDTVVPIFGGTGTEGAFTIVSVPGLTADNPQTPVDESKYRVTYGNSYIQTVTWAPDGAGFKPVAEGFVTYSQSTDPASPHFLDFTQEYSAKRWHRFPFREREIAARTRSSLQLSE
jgi:acyl-homoserine-lactone acylase